MKKGFTLIELTAVIILIASISILGIVSINRNVNMKKNDISDAMQQIINASADIYMGYSIENYPKKYGDVYCIKLNKLTDLDILQSPIIDPVTKETIAEDKFIRIEISSSTIYSLVDTCTEKR